MTKQVLIKRLQSLIRDLNSIEYDDEDFMLSNEITSSMCMLRIEIRKEIKRLTDIGEKE